MQGSVTISPGTPARASQDYARLREAGMNVIRKVAGETWTDHNLHDPGITLLEAFCYAVTEAGLKAGMDLRDLIESGKVIAQPEFFTAARVLPVAPVTPADFRKVLIDHPLVRNAWLSKVDVIPKGRYDVLLEYADDVINAFRFTETIITAIDQYLVEISFPHWDEPEVIPLRTNVDLVAAVFDNATWSPIEGSDAWFNRILLDYQPPAGPVQTTSLWVVVRIVSPIADPPAELPLILQATGSVILTLGDNSPADLTLHKRYQRRVIAANETTSLIARYLVDHRNLCEYFHEFRSARLQEIAFAATIEITPGTNIEEFLSDVFLEVDQMISPVLNFQSLQLLSGLSSDLIYDGPLLDHGFLSSSEELYTPLPQHIYSSDILRITFQQGTLDRADVQSRAPGARTIVAVRNLSLSNYLDGRNITSGARDCLTLVDSNRHIPRFSPAKCKVFFYRDGIEVAYDLQRVLDLFAQKKAELVSGSLPGSSDLKIPTGEAFDVSDYFPIQNDLPLTYGAGEAGLPDHATSERRAKAKQLKGFLMLAEQLLAGYVVQLENINRFFSSDTALDSTMFQQPLYYLPGVADLLKAFDSTTTTWQAFVNNPANAYERMLADRTESHDQFLDRRNRLLDHLLARMGEHMEELGALEIRRAATVPGAAGMTLPQLLAAQSLRRRQALQRLISSKSAFYRDLPELQMRRLQAFGNVLWNEDSFIIISQVPSGVHWHLADTGGLPVLESVSPAANVFEAGRLGHLTISLATQPGHYRIVPEAGQRRLMIDGASGVIPIARSVQLFPTVAAAQTALQSIAQEIRNIWLTHGLMAFERRLYHLLPVRTKRRRSLLQDLNTFFEILNDPAGGALNEKIFRLWELPGFSGAELLHSEGNFPGATNAIAITNAEAGVREVIAHGIYPENYDLDGVVPNISIILRDTAGTILARSSPVFTDQESARNAIPQVADHIYAHYSFEGFYVLEHIHLFTKTGVLLEIPSSAKDPFSFQLSVVFPSGFVKDFAADTATADSPVHYRDPEFRKHAERMIRQSCPAHILPRVYWVDRATDSTVLAGSEPCFDLFESRYLAWLEAYLTDQVDPAVIEPLRDDLVTSLNSVIAEAETP